MQSLKKNYKYLLCKLLCIRFASARFVRDQYQDFATLCTFASFNEVYRFSEYS